MVECDEAGGVEAAVRPFEGFVDFGGLEGGADVSEAGDGGGGGEAVGSGRVFGVVGDFFEVFGGDICLRD